MLVSTLKSVRCPLRLVTLIVRDRIFYATPISFPKAVGVACTSAKMTPESADPRTSSASIAETVWTEVYRLTAFLLESGSLVRWIQGRTSDPCSAKNNRRAGLRSDQTSARLPAIPASRLGKGKQTVGAGLHDAQPAEALQGTHGLKRARLHGNSPVGPRLSGESGQPIAHRTARSSKTPTRNHGLAHRNPSVLFTQTGSQVGEALARRVG
jgi:hypothetical protein